MEKLHEMQTDERGSIESIRREKLTTHEIWAEILGNISASHLNIFLRESTLYIHQNDGGLNDKDKVAVIAKMISTKKEDTASVNGIGIRMALDSICERCKCIEGISDRPVNLISVTADKKERMEFHFMEYPSWQTNEWTSANEVVLDEFYKSNEKMCLDRFTTGTMWIVPLNKEFVTVIQETKHNSVRDITRLFFNRKLHSKKIHVWYMGESLPTSYPLCDKDTHTFRFTYHEQDNTRRKTRRIVPDKNTLEQYEFLNKNMNFPCSKSDEIKFDEPKQKKGFKPEDYSEDIVIRMRKYTYAEYEKITTSYNMRFQLKGLWVYINDMCILSQPTLNGSGTKDYLQSDLCPILEVELSRDTKMFKFSRRKSESQPTEDGNTLCKIIWALLNEVYGIQKDKPKEKKMSLKTEIDTLRKAHDTLRKEHELLKSQEQPDAQEQVNAPTNNRYIPHVMKNDIWQRLFKVKLEQKCPCCRMVDIMPFSSAFEWSHIEANKNGGTAKGHNIIPICRDCNRKMGTRNLIKWTKEIFPGSIPYLLEYLKEYYSGHYTIDNANV